MQLFIKIKNPNNRNKNVIDWNNPESNKDSIEQVKVVRSIVRSLKNCSETRICTRSIYIVGALSNLMTAFCVAKLKPENKKKIAAFIPEHLWVNPKNVRYYTGEREIDLWDENTKSIDLDFIDLDAGSKKINEECDKLFNIEHEVSE